MTQHRSRKDRLEMAQWEMRERNRKPADNVYEKAIEESGLTYGEWLRAQALRFGITVSHCENLIRKTWPGVEAQLFRNLVPAIMIRTSWRLTSQFVAEFKTFHNAIYQNGEMQ